MSIDAMKQALEALELLERYDNHRAMLTDDAIEGVWQTADEAITAIRAAIEQAEKPWVKSYAGNRPNYTVPEQCEWRGLTEEERLRLRSLGLAGVEIIEGLLEERNRG
jgi:hypothetical protein